MKVFFFMVVMGVSLIGANAEAALTNSSPEKPVSVVHVDKAVLLKIVDKFLDDIRQDRAADAYNELTTKKFREQTSLDRFKSFIAQTSALSKNKLFQYHSFYVEDDIATFQGDLISTDGLAVAAEFDFVQEEGQWKIMGLQLYQPEKLTLPQ